MTIGDIVGEAIDVHKMAADKKERYDIIIEMLRRVGLNSEHANGNRNCRNQTLGIRMQRTRNQLVAV